MNDLLRYGTEPQAFKEGFSPMAHDNEVNFIFVFSITNNLFSGMAYRDREVKPDALRGCF